MIPLIYYRYQGSEEEIFLSSAEEIIIGSSVAKDVSLCLFVDDQVAERHALLSLADGTCSIEDLGNVGKIYYNGKLVTGKTYLRSGDEIKIGNTVLRLYFAPILPFTLDTAQGYVDVEIDMQKSSSTSRLTEHERLVILGNIEQIVTSNTGQEVLDHFVKTILKRFALADTAGIVFFDNNEILPVSYSPIGQSHVSFSLAERAIHGRKSFIWERAAASEASLAIPSLVDTVSAMYTPIIVGRRVLGLLHIDTSSIGGSFEEDDLELLGEFAIAIGQCIKMGVKEKLLIPSVFVSYSHDDKEFVDNLARRLRRIPIRVWYDDQLPLGEEWEKQLTAAIEAVDAFVLVMSPSSMTSKWVRWEIEQARKLGLKVFPLLLHPCKIPRELKRIQYVEVGTNPNVAITKLVDKLYSLKEA